MGAGLAGQALIGRDQLQVLGITPELVVLARVVEEDGMRHVPQPRLGNSGLQKRPQARLLDADEEVLQVTLEIPGRDGPVLGLTADMAVQALDGIERATALDAGAAIGDESTLEARADDVIDILLNNPVSIFGSPYLTGLRVLDHEADAWAWAVGTALQFLIERYQLVLKVEFEPEGAGGIPLAPAARYMGLIEVFERKCSMAVDGCLCGRRRHGTCCSCCYSSSCRSRSSGNGRCWR